MCGRGPNIWEIVLVILKVNIEITELFNLPTQKLVVHLRKPYSFIYLCNKEI